MPGRHLITSALPYINGVKHLGNLIGSMLPADVYARYLRSRGREVLFICATDEHGTPAELAALDEGLDVAEYCRRQHAIQAELARTFRLSFDHFGRSSSPQNHELTHHFAHRLEQNGFIEERTTRQIYSIDDRRFLPDRYVVGTCPHCGFTSARGDQCENCTRVLDPTELVDPRSAMSGSKNLEIRESRHLFLRLNRLAGELRSWIDAQTDWPPLTTSIARKWLDEGLQDRCITRDLKWGVPVNRPGFEDKVFYVWFDAPIEYIAATKEWSDLAPSTRDWTRWWQDESVHYAQFMAKDNVPFHTIVFPATLLGTRERWKLPNYIKAFNWLTYEGDKFSTSRKRGVFMSDAAELLPADYWRYFLISNAPESADADFTWPQFAASVNKDLVSVIGNFVSRIVKFAISRFDAMVPPGGVEGPLEQKLAADVATQLADLERLHEGLSFRKAAQALRALWSTGNLYLQDAAPWKEIAVDRERSAVVVRTAINLLRILAVVSEPVIPDASQRVFEGLALSPEERKWPSGPIADELRRLGQDRAVCPVENLFRRLSDDEVEAWSERFRGQGATAGVQTLRKGG